MKPAGGGVKSCGGKLAASTSIINQLLIMKRRLTVSQSYIREEVNRDVELSRFLKENRMFGKYIELFTDMSNNYWLNPLLIFKSNKLRGVPYNTSNFITELSMMEVNKEAGAALHDIIDACFLNIMSGKEDCKGFGKALKIKHKILKRK